mmetsp:Transcript_884/g.3460  ORF Transcript_884/g.3460 Transcript_884/m.3460 type:complete len:211 (+) Transcript_884:945-1577(+)
MADTLRVAVVPGDANTILSSSVAGVTIPSPFAARDALGNLASSSLRLPFLPARSAASARSAARARRCSGGSAAGSMCAASRIAPPATTTPIVAPGRMSGACASAAPPAPLDIAIAPSLLSWSHHGASSTRSHGGASDPACPCALHASVGTLRAHSASSPAPPAAPTSTSSSRSVCSNEAAPRRYCPCAPRRSTVTPPAAASSAAVALEQP